MLCLFQTIQPNANARFPIAEAVKFLLNRFQPIFDFGNILVNSIKPLDETFFQALEFSLQYLNIVLTYLQPPFLCPIPNSSSQKRSLSFR